jgi:hypothetical protein
MEADRFCISCRAVITVADGFIDSVDGFVCSATGLVSSATVFVTR